MELIVNDIQNYKEFIFKDVNVKVESGLLNNEEQRDMALKLMEAAWELLPLGSYDSELREVINLIEETM